MYSVYKEYYKKHGDSKLLNYTGSTQLGILSYVIFCGYLVYNSNLTVNLLDIFLLCVATILLIVTTVINKGFKKENADELEKVILEYKKHIEQNRKEVK